MTEPLRSLDADFPKRVSGRWFKLSSTDVQFIVFGLICIFAVNHFAGKAMGFLSVVLLGVLIAPFDYGRFYSVLGQYLGIAWLNRRHSGAVWESDQKTRLPQTEPVPVAIFGIDELGLLRTADNRDIVVVEAQGSRLASLELDSQFDAHRDLADIIRKVASMHEARGQNIGWGWLYRTRPLDIDGLHTSLGDYLHGQVLVPSALDRPVEEWSVQDRRWLAYGENVQQLLDVTYEYARNVTMAAVCTMPRQRIDDDLSPDAARRLPAVQTANLLASELEGNGVIDPRPLDPAQMHGFLRGAWDIKNISDYYEWRLKSTTDEILVSDRHHPQQKIEAGHDYVLIDGSYTSVIWVKGYEGRILPFSLRQLCDINVPYLSVSLIGNVKSYNLEYAWLDRISTVSEETERILGVVHKGPRAGEKVDSRLNRQRRIYESRYSMDFNVLVAVHHIDREGLEQAVDTALQQIRLSNLVGERVLGSTRQLPFALSATTAVDFTTV